MNIENIDYCKKGGVMAQKTADKAVGFRFRSPVLFLAILFTLIGMASLACGVESGDRRAARSEQIVEFHRSPVTAFEQLRIDIALEGDACTSTPADINVTSSQRIRLAIQLPVELVQTTGSAQVAGDTVTLTYQIQGLEITGSGGALGTGVKEINLEINQGARTSYDFNTANTGSFDILCDGAKAGTFTVTEG